MSLAAPALAWIDPATGESSADESGGGVMEPQAPAIPAPPPPPATTPAQTPVGDLGRTERLAETLHPFYRPAAITPARGSGLLDGPAGPVGPGDTPLVYPLERRALASNPYGWRLAQDRQLWRMHTGLDLIVPEGTTVLAAQAGTVRLVDWVGGYGLTVILEHGSGWQTLYAHLGEITVLPGQSLAAGETLGRVGRTGRASTAHLHFEVRRRLEGGTVALDPAPLLRVAAQDAVADQPGGGRDPEGSKTDRKDEWAILDSNQ